MLAEVGLQRVQVQRAHLPVPALGQHREVVAAAVQKAAHDHAHRLRVGQWRTVQHHLADARPGGLAQVVAVAEAAGHRQHPGPLHRVAAAGELLLQHRADLRTGEGLHHQLVAEGLHRVQLAIPHQPLPIRHQVGTQAAGVHERQLRAPLFGRTRGQQLGIGHQVAQNALQRRVGLAPHGALGLAHGPLGQWNGSGAVGVDDLLHPRVCREGRHGGGDGHQALGTGKGLALHHHIARRLAHHATGPRVHTQLDVGEQRAVLACAGQQEGFGRVHAAVVAHIGLVRVARDHHIHGRVQALQDGHDVARQACAAGLLHARRGAAPFVDGHHDHIGPLGLELRDQCVGRGRLVFKPQPRHARRADHGGRGLQREADKAHGDSDAAFGKPLEPRGGQQGAPVLAHRVGRQQAKLGALKRLADAAGLARGEFFAAAVLQPQQLAPAPVKLVVADRIEVYLDAVDRLDGGFVQEQRRHQRRGAHHVTRRHHGMVRRLGLEGGHGAGKVGHAPSRRQHQARGPLHPVRHVGRLQVAVQVVEAD